MSVTNGQPASDGVRGSSCHWLIHYLIDQPTHSNFWRTRHVEIDGHEFPFSRGVSFYEFDADGKMLKARDVVEGSVKPGTATLRVIGVLAPLVRKLGPRASPAFLPAAAVWSFYAGIFADSLFFNAP